MDQDIKCPGEMIYSLLDHLTLSGYKKLESYVSEDVRERIVRTFPFLKDNLPEGLISTALAEQERFKQIKEQLVYYASVTNYPDNIIMGASEGLSKHVSNCRKDEGSCLDRYMLWLENKARLIFEREGDEEDIKIEIDKLDRRVLDLFIY